MPVERGCGVVDRVDDDEPTGCRIGSSDDAVMLCKHASMVGGVLRVLVVDDHEVVRDGIRALLEVHEDIVVVAEAESIQEAVTAADRYRPDVVVMDVRLTDGSGIEATREIRARH